MKNIDHALGVDVFNARDLSAPAVATRFIAPELFGRLLSDAHCVLEGPRGSGKTTLLRMLTPEAFAIWDSAESRNPEEKVKFIGIFVPADVRWTKQITIRLEGMLDPLARGAVEQSIFSTAVSLALIDTIDRCDQLYERFGKDYPELFFTLTRQNESTIVEHLSSLWGLDIGVKSFSGLRFALRLRQHDLGRMALRLATGVQLSDILSDKHFVGSSWLDNLVTAIETVNDILERREQRWAILLDELEIIPPELLKTIVGALRSTTQKLRLKLALSPTGSNLIATGAPGTPTPGNDYRSIPLWHANREDARTFSEALFRSVLARSSLDSPLDLFSLLGPSMVIDGEDESTEEADTKEISTAAQRARQLAFESLYGKDASFKIILDKKGIDIKELPTQDSAENGPFIRKITPLVMFRDREIDGFDTEKNRTNRKGGRKSSQPYIGYPNLIDLAEGNPRWILTLAEAIKAKASPNQRERYIRGVQTKAVDEFVRQFVAKLLVYPTSATGVRNGWTPFHFISTLAQKLEDALYGGPFTTDPSLSFKIDQLAMNHYGEYIRVAIDLGALVIMRGELAAPLSSAADGQSLVGSRVRISYRLTPEFRLPMKSTKEQNMSAALKAGNLLAGNDTASGLAFSASLSRSAPLSLQYTKQEKLL